MLRDAPSAAALPSSLVLLLLLRHPPSSGPTTSRAATTSLSLCSLTARRRSSALATLFSPPHLSLTAPTPQPLQEQILPSHILAISVPHLKRRGSRRGLSTHDAGGSRVPAPPTTSSASAASAGATTTTTTTQGACCCCCRARAAVHLGFGDVHLRRGGVG